MNGAEGLEADAPAEPAGAKRCPEPSAPARDSMTLNWMPFGDEVQRLGFLAIHRQGDAMEIARLDGETDGGAVLAVDDDVGE